MLRRIVSFLVAALSAVLVLVAFDVAVGVGASGFIAYLLFIYGIAIIAGIPLLLIFHWLSFVRWWQFFLGGVFLAVVGVSSVLGMLPFFSVTLSAWVSYIAQYWHMLVAGGVGGLVYWLAACKTPNKSFKADAVNGAA